MDSSFERFLNPERQSPPDIDMDFCFERRGEIIHYVAKTYGWENVAQITTFGSMKTRQVIRDVGRALEVPYAEVDKIAKLVPEQMKMTVARALEQEPRLRESRDTNPHGARNSHGGQGPGGPAPPCLHPCLPDWSSPTVPWLSTFPFTRAPRVSWSPSST